MQLYSSAIAPYSHICRIVLFEKEIENQIHYVDSKTGPGKLGEYNPYNETPTLVDRDLVLYDAQLICEYLDERLPHPPLMPVDPVSRAKARLMMFRLRRDWVDRITVENDELVIDDATRRTIRDGLTALAPIFRDHNYIMGQDFTMVDCVIGPVLWRLPMLEIDLPSSAKPLIAYAQRLFQRPRFGMALSPQEREIPKR